MKTDSLEQAAALISGEKGENCPEYAKALNNLAVSYFHNGTYKKAEYFITNEVLLRESLKARNELSYLNSLEEASVICRKAGNYEEALNMARKAEKVSLKVYGAMHPDYARTLTFYGGVYYDWGISVNDLVYLKRALDYFEMARKIYSASGEKSKYNLIVNKSDIAAYNNDIGNIPEAESLFTEIIDFTGKEYGDSSPNYASALNNLGVFYYNTGNYKLSEKYLAEAVKVYKQSNQTDEINAAICISNLGALYNDMGNYETALRLTDESRVIFEKDRKQNNPRYAVLLNNIAAILMTEEYYASPEKKNPEHLKIAGETILKADSIFSMNCRNPHSEGFVIKCNLALWYYFKGNYKKCTSIIFDNTTETNLSLRVHSLMNKMSSSAVVPMTEEMKSKPSIELSMIPVRLELVYKLSAEANLYQGVVGSDSAASVGYNNPMSHALVELMMGKANNLKKSIGEYHPAYIAGLRGLIEVYSLVGDARLEEELILKLNNSITHKLLQDFSFMSESEKELYYQTRLPDIHSFLAYCLQRKSKNPSVAGFAYNNVLLNKGLMLKSSTAMRVAILSSNDPELLKLYDEWISIQKELSELYSTPVELRTKDAGSLEQKANELERTLVGKSQDFSDYRKGLQVTWQDVKKNLKPDEAAVEFIDFRNRIEGGGNETIYSALILKSGLTYPEMINLFTEKQLRDIIGSGENVNKIYGTVDQHDTRLYDLIWKPLEPYLSGTKNIYISPSGLLFRISFPALSKDQNTYLSDNYQTRICSSTAYLVSQKSATEPNQSALIFGGIRYSNNDSESQVWNYLEGTRNEGDTINAILGKNKFRVEYLTEKNATETYFKQNAGKYDMLHIATHGFFFDDPDRLKFEENKEIEYGDLTFRGYRGTAGVNNFVNSENPLMRSGLVFAGANEVWSTTVKNDQDDGVLTAQEVTQIDLRRNSLVVLSACETGLGDIKGNEGVYGLQRSLKMAGVKNIIMSLWQIPDRETVEFMGKFYTSFVKNGNINQSFADAQREMRKKYDPYYWAAFVLLE